MSETELRELLVCLAERVMGWKLKEGIGKMEFGDYRISGDQIIYRERGNPGRLFDPMKNKKDAFWVLEKCAEECRRSSKTISIRGRSGDWNVFCRDQYDQESEEAPTLPLAICFFAKAIFSK